MFEKKKKFDNRAHELYNQRSPYVRVIQTAYRNKQKIKDLQSKLKDINKKYKELGKKEPVWKGMRQADDYYSKKEKIKDKFMTLDLKKEILEKEINKLAREANKKLFDVRL